jgi:hypothetical protein
VRPRQGKEKKKVIIAVDEKYVLEVGSPTSITLERQHEEYLSVLDKLASKENPTSEEEKYSEVLLTLIQAYEEEHHSIPMRRLFRFFAP